MANELNIALSTGLTVTARLVQAGAYVGSAIALTESPVSSGFYTGNVPGATAAGTYEVIFLSGSALAGSGRLFWDGAAEVGLLELAARNWANATRSLTDKSGFALTQAFPANFASLGINPSGHVSRVTLVDTTTTNTDMRGTDGALLAGSYTAPPSTSAIATAVETQLSNEFDALPTASENAAAVRSELALELARIDANVSSRSDFDYTSDRVDIGAVQGVSVVSIDDFKADVSGVAADVETALADDFTAIESAIASIPAAPTTSAIATAVNIALADDFTTVNNAIAAIPEAPSASTIADAVDSALLENFATVLGAIALIPTNPLLASNYTAPNNAGITAIALSVASLPTLTQIEASTVLAKQATLTTLVPSGAIARMDGYITRQAALQGLVTGVYAEALEPIDTATPGYYRTSDGEDLAITINVDGSRRIQQA